jgi:glutamate-5-semialdehyde dehydrogenase
MTPIFEAIQQIGRQARQASRLMMRASSAQKAHALHAMADALAEQRSTLKIANQRDIEAAKSRALESALLDRLTLSDRSIDLMIEGLRQIAAMSDPVGELTATKIRPNGMQVAQMRVPLGVIGIIY